MVNKMKQITVSFNKIISYLVLVLFVGIIVFEVQSWKSIPYYITWSLILIFFAKKNDGNIPIVLGKYHVFMILFIIYTLFTAVWAINPSDTFAISRGLILNLFFSSILYFYNTKQNSIYLLLNAIKWAGYIIAIYTIFYYGLDNLILSSVSSATRIENEYANINGIAILIGYACIIEFFFFINYSYQSFSLIMLIPSFIVVAASQSRKALLMIFIGVFFTYILNIINEKNTKKSIIKVIIGIVGIIVITIFITKSPIFSGIRERLHALIKSFIVGNSPGSYIPIRERLISLGIKIWKEHPILGIGMANAHIIAAQELNFDAYLHCNYIELLCGGGLIGFLLYYIMYIYIGVSLWKLRNIDKKAIMFGVVFLLISLATDYGMVSYYGKPECFYLVIQFINIEQLKKKAAGVSFATI